MQPIDFSGIDFDLDFTMSSSCDVAPVTSTTNNLGLWGSNLGGPQQTLITPNTQDIPYFLPSIPSSKPTPGSKLSNPCHLQSSPGATSTGSLESYPTSDESLQQIHHGNTSVSGSEESLLERSVQVSPQSSDLILGAPEKQSQCCSESKLAGQDIGKARKVDHSTQQEAIAIVKGNCSGVTTLSQQTRDFGDEKPPYSYLAMITMAIESSSSGMMTLNQVYDYISKR